MAVTDRRPHGGAQVFGRVDHGADAGKFGQQKNGTGGEAASRAQDRLHRRWPGGMAAGAGLQTLKMKAARAFWRDGILILSFPYHADCIEVLKAEIHPGAREYDPGARVWRIAPHEAARALRIFKHFFPGATEDRTPAAALDLPSWCAVLYVLPNAPEIVVKAAYRALSKAAHPDRGGDTHGMTKLNLALEAAQAARGGVQDEQLHQ